MVVRQGAAQEKAQLISRIVSSVVVRSYALRVQISKGALGAEFLGAGEDGYKDESVCGRRALGIYHSLRKA